MKQLTWLMLPAALLAGCATSTTPQYDSRFGQALRDAKAAQTLNPTPTGTTAQGLDGKAAREAMDRYQDSFKTPPVPVNVINIGSGSGSSR